MAKAPCIETLDFGSSFQGGPSSPSTSSSEIRADEIFALSEKTSRFAVVGALHNGMRVMLRFFTDPNVPHNGVDGKEHVKDRGSGAKFIQRCTAHGNVLDVVGICRELGAIVVEVCQPLRDFLASWSNAPLRLAAQMVLGCVEGLIYLHDTLGKVWERDGNPLEFLVAGNTIKVADDQVSSSSYFSSLEERVRYSAPEILSLTDNGSIFKGNLRASDVYSVGVLMWCLICGSEPWCDKTTDDIRQMVLGGERPSVPNAIVRSLQQEQSTQSYLTLMKNCWHQNENNRPTLTEVRGGLLEILCLLEEEEEVESMEHAVAHSSFQCWVGGNAGSAVLTEEESIIPYEGPQRGLPPIMLQGPASCEQKSGLLVLVRKMWRAVVRLLRLRWARPSNETPPPLPYDAIGIRAPSPEPAIGVPFSPSQCRERVSPFSQPPPLPPLNPLGKSNRIGTMMVVDRVPNQLAWGKVRGYSVNCIMPDTTKHPMWNDIVVIAIGNATVPPRKIWDHFLDVFFNTSAPEFRRSEHWNVMRTWLMKPMVPKVEGDSIKWKKPETGSGDFENDNSDTDGRSLVASSSIESSHNIYRELAISFPLDDSDSSIEGDLTE